MKPSEIQRWLSSLENQSTEDRLPVEEYRRRLAQLIVDKSDAERDVISQQAEEILKKLLKL